MSSGLAGFDDAVFISYTHIDNEPFGPDDLRWVAHLHEQLANRVQQVLGAHVSVWRDDKLQGNDVFAETLVERLSKVAVLVSVCSPRYFKSDWCQRELEAFVGVAEAGSGLQVGSKSRVFKLLKTPVPYADQPSPLDGLLGYEFYEEAAEDRRVREFLVNPDPEARWKFYARVDDLAQDIASLLGDLQATSDPSTQGPEGGRTVFLAETTSDLTPARDRVKRELERRGHRVLPERSLPLVRDELIAAVDEELSRSELAIHLLGGRYGARPEGEDRSVPHVLLDQASQRALDGGFTQLIWIRDGLDPVEDVQAGLVRDLEAADLGAGIELVRAPLESFKAYAMEQLSVSSPPETSLDAGTEGLRVYLVCDRDDRAAAETVRAELEAAGHTVVFPLGEGTEAEAREVHEMEMVLSDAVLIYYGTATEHWVRMKLFDLLKAPGWGRTTSFRAKAVYVAAPTTPEKDAYATGDALVVRAADAAESSPLEPFLAEMAASGPLQ